MIEQHVHWNDDIGEWQLRCVAYTGNNMRKQSPQPDKDKEKVHHFLVLTVFPFREYLEISIYWKFFSLVKTFFSIGR